MSTRQPTSQRTKLRTAAYLAGFSESTGQLASYQLGQVARCFTHRLLGDRPAGWKFGTVMGEFRRGWRDKATGQPCRPWQHGESERQG